MNRKERTGELYLFSEAFLWALFPVVSILAFARVPALLTLGWVTLFATLFFAALMTYKKRWGELKDPQVLKYGFLIALFIGLGYYVIYFLGLAHTTAGNAALLVNFEVLTTYVFFNMLRGEKFSAEYTVGALLMVCGVSIVLGKDFSAPNIGDILIVLATVFPPIGNLCVQKARERASAETVMFLRSVFMTPLIFLIAYFLGERASGADIIAVLPLLLFSGVLLMGLSKIFWVEAVHRISVTKAMALQSVTPFLTLTFAWILLSQKPDFWQLSSLPLFFLGVLFLTGYLHLPGKKAS